MFKVGITGGIGSGKTTVCKIFEVLGIPVFYADAAAKTVMHTDEALRNSIKTAFGAESYDETNQLNRKYIASLVFNNDLELAKLNNLVHPAVFRAFDDWVLQQTNVPYVLKEAALLFESGSFKRCDKSILVIAPQVLKIQRVTSRDNSSIQEVLSRMKRQFTDEEKSSFADYTITNDEHHLLIPQVLKLHGQFLSLIQK